MTGIPTAFSMSQRAMANRTVLQPRHTNVTATGWRTSPDAIAAPPSTGVPGAGLEAAGTVLQFAGLLQSAIGAYFAADAQKHLAKTQALSAEFEQSMSEINARSAEIEADNIMKAGGEEISRSGMEFAQVKEENRASTAAAGIEGGGSAAEVQASIELTRRLEAFTINKNRVQAAGAARMRAVDARNRGAIAGVSARNLRSTASTIRPEVSAAGSLIGSAGQLASFWAANRRGGR